MKKIAAIFTLKNRDATIRVTAPEGAFQKIDDQVKLAPFPVDAENSSLVSEDAPAEKHTPAALCAFESEAEYEQFRQLWDINSAAPAQESASQTKRLSKDLFEKCLLTADSLRIQGEYAERFAESMVKYGLFRRHSAKIMASKDLSTYNLSQDIFWALLHAFLRQAGFAYRTTHPSAGQTMLRIESTSVQQFKKIDKEYTGPSQQTRMRTVLYSELGRISSQEKKKNEEVLAWLLLSLGGSSVDIQYDINLYFEDIKKTIYNLAKENEQGARVYVEGLTFDAHSSWDDYDDLYSKASALIEVLQLVPPLTRVEIDIFSPFDIPSDIISSLISEISSCTSLKALTITNYILGSAEVSILADSLPNIEQLSIWCKPLERTAVESLKKWTRLEKLEIDGHDNQPSTIVQALVAHLPSLKELNIMCDPLTPAAAEAFQACTQLEKLIMYGWYQSSTAVQALVAHLPSLKELTIECNVLEPAAAEAFQACTKLEKLEMWEEKQPSTTVQAIATHLPSLKHLRIGIGSADFALADVLQKCPNLHFLELSALQYTPGFLAR
ncbi:hypothetical protein NECID01_1950, partial [Nematocida sp. AWRm77]